MAERRKPPKRRAGDGSRGARAGASPRPAAATPRRSRRAVAPIGHPVRVMFLDVDGTLTDGVIAFSRAGDARNFWVRDGLALEWAREAGIVPVVISGRPSLAVEARMADLKLEFHLGAKDKVSIADRVRAREGVRWDECMMVGDDLPDVALMKRVGWAVAVADASPDVLPFAHTVTKAPAGRGAVREIVEAVLRHNGAWADVLARYEARP